MQLSLSGLHKWLLSCAAAWKLPALETTCRHAGGIGSRQLTPGSCSMQLSILAAHAIDVQLNEMGAELC